VGSMQMKTKVTIFLTVLCSVTGCVTSSSSLIRNEEFRHYYLAWRPICERETRHMNGLISAYTGTEEFDAMVGVGKPALADVVRLGRAYDVRHSSRYDAKNSCDRFMANVASLITGIHAGNYSNRMEFWQACEAVR
jgi:hypothetical protein